MCRAPAVPFQHTMASWVSGRTAADREGGSATVFDCRESIALIIRVGVSGGGSTKAILLTNRQLSETGADATRMDVRQNPLPDGPAV